jgi:hypothetical protein
LHVKGVFFPRISPERLRATRPAFQVLSSKPKLIRVFVMAGHSRPKDGVASARLCPAIHVFLAAAPVKTWMPGTSPGMTNAPDPPNHRRREVFERRRAKLLLAQFD